MDNRSIDILDTAHANTKHGTTHVHAYVRGANGWYTIFVCPYTPEDGTLSGIRRYPLSATVAVRVAPMPRFSAKRLAEIAADPTVLHEARALAGME